MRCIYLTGIGGDKGLTIDDLEAFRQVGSKTPGHPEYGHTVGVETTTGPLGQGIATAVGMAIAERMMAAQFPSNIVDHRTYVIASDGDLMEGVSQEAIAIAGHARLSKLIVFYDDNGISIDGNTSLSDAVDQVARFQVGRMERKPHRRTRRRGDPEGDQGRADLRPADHDRLQDDDRLRLAPPAGNAQSPRRRLRRR